VITFRPARIALSFFSRHTEAGTRRKRLHVYRTRLNLVGVSQPPNTRKVDRIFVPNYVKNTQIENKSVTGNMQHVMAGKTNSLQRPWMPVFTYAEHGQKLPM
jgi:hypothetical protein